MSQQHNSELQPPLKSGFLARLDSFPLKLKVIFSIATSLIIGLVLYLFVQQWEKQLMWSDFQFKAEGHAAAIQSELRHSVNIVKSMQNMLDDDLQHRRIDPFQPAAFMPRYQAHIQHYPQALTLEWLSKQSTTQKQATEKHSLHLTQSVHTSSQGQAILQIAVPVGITHTEHTVESTALSGILLSTWNLSGLIEDAIQPLPVSAQDLLLYYTDASNHSQLAYTHLSRSRTDTDRGVNTDIQYHIAFTIQGMQWALDIEAAPQFLRDHPSWKAELALLLSLLGGIIFSFFLAGVHKQHAAITAIAEARTKELQQQTDKLQKSKARYSTLVEMIQHGIIVHRHGHLLYSNQHSVQAFGHQNLNILADQDAQTSAGEQRNSTIECALSMPGSSTIFVRVSATDIDYDGYPARLLAIQDITAIRLASEKLEHKGRLDSLGVLAGGIAHDFNNILSAILSHASEAIKHPKLEPELMHHLSAVVNASETAAHLCDQMLNYSGKGQLVIKNTNLSSTVKNMQNIIDVSAPKGVSISYDMSSDLPTVKADRTQLQQVILNLVINAVEAIETSGAIRIKTGQRNIGPELLQGCAGYHGLKPGNYAYLKISDNGKGMNPDTLDKMFDPYFSTKGSGRGLGMSALLGIINAHKAGIHYYSEPGIGTAVHVIFPVAAQTEIEAVQTMEIPVLQEQIGGTVLLVDDEAIIRIAASSILENLGFDVITANDGLEALQIFKQRHDQILFVILDLSMPRMDGATCFKALRRVHPDVRILISSGYSESRQAAHIIGDGLASFIKKPYSSDDLSRKIREVLE